MNYDLIKAAIAAVIKENGNEEITGNILQQSLLAIIDVLGLGYQYAGIATPATNPGTPDAKVFYIAQAKGTYSNFNDGTSSPILDGTAIGLFAFDTQWHNTILDVATKSSVDTIVQGITEALADKIDKVADVTPGNLPKFTANGGLEDSDIPATDVATKQELAVATLPGLAEAVIDTDGAGTEQQFTFRKSGGDGGAYYRKIKGKSVAVNQIADPARFENTITRSNVTFTNNGDGTITVNGTPDDYEAAYILLDTSFGDVLNTKKGHKIYLRGSIGDVIVSSWNNQDGTHTGIFTVPSTDMFANLVVTFDALATADNVKITPEVIDLTLWFGAGNEPTSVAEFEALYHDPLPYTPGTLKSNDAEAVETTGANQWDEEWGNYLWDEGNGGVRSANPNSFGCAEHIPVLPSTNYYLASISGGVFHVLFYDAEKNFISYQYPAQSFTTPANCAYITFYSYQSYGTVYNHDICINISNPAINGQYFPYWKRTLQLGITTRKDTDGNVPFANGMKGAGTASDWADKVGGEKRMKRVDLGNVNWEYNATYQFFIGATILDNPIGVAGVTPNMICPKYETYETRYDSQVAGGPDKIISGYSAANGVIIYDTDHSAADLVDGHAAWLEGVMLDYELATPVPFTWAEPLNLGVKVDENGTERAVAPEGATAPSAPFVADTTYTMSIARMVAKLQTI